MPYISPSITSITSSVLDINLAVEAKRLNLSTGRMDETDFMSGFEDYAAANPVYPRNEWADRIEQMDKDKAWMQYFITYGHYQDGEPSCVYNMLSTITEATWNKQFGTHNAINLSPISGYRWNGSRTSGSNIFGSAAWSEGTGLVPLNDSRNLALVAKGYFKHTHPHNGYGTSMPDGWKETARSFRLQEWYRITSVEAWVSAALNGFCLGGGRDGHAICHPLLGLDGSNLFSGYINSWGPWGSTLEIANGVMLKSFGWDSERKIQSMVNHGAYAGRTIRKPDWFPISGVL